MIRRGYPLTKVAYMRLMHGGSSVPTFPLDAEVASAVPRYLSGALPRNLTEYWVTLKTSSASSRRPSRPRSPRG